MTGLLLYSDESAVAASIAEHLPGTTRRLLHEMVSPSPGDRPALALRHAPSTTPVVAADGAAAELLVAALRATGVPAAPEPHADTAVPTIILPDLGHRDGERIADAVARWCGAHANREVLLASPRSACAGVDRAVEIVELALLRFGSPVYVRKQIVHNEHIVADLTKRGAVFVDSVDEVPKGAVVVFSAHGVSPAVRAAAAERDLVTIDATCPLVAKVHSEARGHVRQGRTIAYIGHAGHEESEGTLGEAPDAMHLVETVEDVARLQVDDPHNVAFLTQTTLASDEVEEIVTALRSRYPDAKGPRGEDICYATTNRQQAVRAVAAQSDLVLVVGSRTSSNANRLVEVATRSGAPAVLVEDATELDPALLHNIFRIGLTAAASTPEPLVERVVEALRTLGQVDIDEVRVAREDIVFSLPAALR
ncbi:4-hydroxy-3-methylbut-2-enyl diphosphate reductase [Saccharothrix tamanrassetensis]|uniref:4-hydroxy-3-methylbut-2-enyl diphosphate reductase n=1 Tax=Saccharothrix tamanrassetensis TaxID=1051531 RepID=A0A841CMJ2_9PSEU|nr:4-hydroxy-3-methylbut-2-enyl diphosphate reductase [Saccharothrix tamanrassetensis]MBB5957307.1 4-hydroxy-3-methylbut-2-enyl diphosphate reductase [Saccharothrix tamanrassetensis]